MTISEREAAAALSTVAADSEKVRSAAWAMGASALLEQLQSASEDSGLPSPLPAVPEAVLEQGTRAGARFVMPGDSEWPAQLQELAMLDPAHAPIGVWVRGSGDLAALTDSSVAVTGSRSSTAYGEGVARAVGVDLARAEVTVVNGGAFGVDQAALRGSLSSGGRQVVVLAGGVDRPYPVAHSRLFEAVAEEGLVVSELPPGAAPTRTRFLGRNRLVACLSLGTVIVEAAQRSGALNTAEWAHRLQHPLLAVPGPITSACSAGTHELLASGQARILRAASDAVGLAILEPIPGDPATL